MRVPRGAASFLLRPPNMPNSNGRFIWHELSTTDVDAAMAFYMEITPWKTERFQESTYTMWMNDGAPVGGVIPLAPAANGAAASPHWMPYVGVYDVDECVRQVRSLGGNVKTGPTEIPNVGAWAVITDPSGAAIGLYEHEAEGPAPIAGGRRGEFSWHELMTTDCKAALEFYKALFKWESTGESDMGPLGIYYLFGMDGQPFGGMYNKSPDMPAPAWWSYIQVDDAVRTAAQVSSLGGAVITGPVEVPGGDSIAILTDPQGVPFAVHAPRRQIHEAFDRGRAGGCRAVRGTGHGVRVGRARPSNHGGGRERCPMPAATPAFFRTASRQLAYLNPEPDRWRDRAEQSIDPALEGATAPEHFIDMEMASPAVLAAALGRRTATRISTRCAARVNGPRWVCFPSTCSSCRSNCVRTFVIGAPRPIRPGAGSRRGSSTTRASSATTSRTAPIPRTRAFSSTVGPVPTRTDTRPTSSCTRDSSRRTCSHTSRLPTCFRAVDPTARVLPDLRAAIVTYLRESNSPVERLYQARQGASIRLELDLAREQGVRRRTPRGRRAHAARHLVDGVGGRARRPAMGSPRDMGARSFHRSGCL